MKRSRAAWLDGTRIIFTSPFNIGYDFHCRSWTRIGFADVIGSWDDWDDIGRECGDEGDSEVED